MLKQHTVESMSNSTLSVIVPVYNEAKSLEELHADIASLYEKYPSMEIIFVDDGSTDGSTAVLRKIADKDKRSKLIVFRRNHGQTAAIMAGFDNASGDILIPIDSDLENDPHDIPKFVEMIESGNDVVSGWRRDRWKGKFLTRKIPSVVANTLISKATGVALHDYGCTLKAYRREVIAGVPLYGEMHRFIPAYAAWQGGRVREIPVHFTPRKFGKSKYGVSRTFRVLLDLFLIRFMHRYMDRPIHFFGGAGFILSFLGVIAGMGAIVLRFWFGMHLVQTPLPLLSALLLIMGVNLVMMGILAEMQMRTYYEARGSKQYLIREKVNF